jgi:hypothetical protein
VFSRKKVEVAESKRRRGFSNGSQRKNHRYQKAKLKEKILLRHAR